MKKMNYQFCFKSSYLASGFRTGGWKSLGSPPGTFLTVSAENVTLIMRMRSQRITVKYLIRFYRLVKIQRNKVFWRDFSTSGESGESFLCSYLQQLPTSNSQGQINER